VLAVEHVHRRQVGEIEPDHRQILACVPAWRYDPSRPLVFTHIPKCAGTSVAVGLAAALAAVTAIALFYALGGTQTRSDPLRVIEGTAAAIGVIAAALIFIGERSVRNLTSATYLWLVATIGIAFGAGLYPVALIGTVLGLLLLTVARMFEDKPFGAHDDGQG